MGQTGFMLAGFWETDRADRAYVRTLQMANF